MKLWISSQNILYFLNILFWKYLFWKSHSPKKEVARFEIKYPEHNTEFQMYYFEQSEGN